MVFFSARAGQKNQIGGQHSTFTAQSKGKSQKRKVSAKGAAAKKPIKKGRVQIVSSPKPRVSKKKEIAAKPPPKPKAKRLLPSQIPSKRSLSSRPGLKKKRKIDVRLELQKVAEEGEDEKEAEDPLTPGGPLKE